MQPKHSAIVAGLTLALSFGAVAAPATAIAEEPTPGVASDATDIDIAVTGCRDFDRFSYLIEECLDTLLDVDVVNLDESLSQQLLDEIARDGVVLYEKI